MSYEVFDDKRIDDRSGLNPGATTYAERLQAALNNQKSERGMELVTAVATDRGPLYIFWHETDRLPQ